MTGQAHRRVPPQGGGGRPAAARVRQHRAGPGRLHRGLLRAADHTARLRRAHGRRRTARPAGGTRRLRLRGGQGDRQRGDRDRGRDPARRTHARGRAHRTRATRCPSSPATWAPRSPPCPSCGSRRSRIGATRSSRRSSTRGWSTPTSPGIPTEASIMRLVERQHARAAAGRVLPPRGRRQVRRHPAGSASSPSTTRACRGRRRSTAFTAFTELKHVILVDDDVDLFDTDDVLWAMTTRYQGDVSTVLIPGVRCHPLDPTQSREYNPLLPRRRHHLQDGVRLHRAGAHERPLPAGGVRAGRDPGVSLVPRLSRKPRGSDLWRW